MPRQNFLALEFLKHLKSKLFYFIAYLVHIAKIESISLSSIFLFAMSRLNLDLQIKVKLM